MKKCIEAHDALGFGHVPVGSLWADDSPFVQEADKFEDIETEAPVQAPKVRVRKFKEVGDGDPSLD